MPDVFVYTSKERSEKLKKALSQNGALAIALRLATAAALGDVPASHVEVRLLASEAEDNTTRVQVLCMVSATPEREVRMNAIFFDWAREIARAWAEVRKELPELEEFPPQELGIWPTMPNGNWFLASDLIKS